MAHQLALELPPGAPSVDLLEADSSEVDEIALQSAARRIGGEHHTSRSYRYPYALVARHVRPVGVDIERIESHDEAFLDSILTPTERTSLKIGSDARSVSSLWCSKEALAKALGDALRYDPRRLDSPLTWPGASSGPWRAIELRAPPGYVAWLCWRSV